jgi:small subunit ribosomal protein S20
VAHSLSAQKRIRQSARRRDRNRGRRKALRVENKKLEAVIAGGDVAAAAAEVKVAIKLLDRTATRGTVHRNTAARRKSKLQKKINALAAGKK